jgi:hypothetical protein
MMMSAKQQLLILLKDIPDNVILIDHFLDRAKEAEIDAIYRWRTNANFRRDGTY